jgi:hypothetical protein
MKILFFVLFNILAIVTNSYAQSNTPLSQKDSGSFNNKPPDSFLAPYRNKQSTEERDKHAKRYNLSVSEYLRRDEIAETECKKYFDLHAQIANEIMMAELKGKAVSPKLNKLDYETYMNYHICRNSKLLNISFTETEMRHEKANKNCSSLQGAQKDSCDRNFIVLGK